MHCPACGLETPAEAAFCPLCGLPRPPVAAQPAPSLPAPGGARYAGFWLRFTAHLLDGTVIAIATFIPLVIAVAVFAKDFDITKASTDAETMRAIAVFAGPLLALIFYVGLWLYHALMTSSAYQGTLGKMALGLKVTDLDGNRISFWRASLRFFGTLVSNASFSVGYLIQPFTARKQTLHDLIAGTLVVRP